MIALRHTCVDEADMPAPTCNFDESMLDAAIDKYEYGMPDDISADYCATIPHVSLALASPFQKLTTDSCC